MKTPALTIILFVAAVLLSAPHAMAENQIPFDEEVVDEYNDFDDFDEFTSPESGSTKPVFDPLRGYNRLIFNFNDKMYFWVLKPVGTGYSKAVPEPARLSIRRFFHNIKFPVRFVNNILQFKIAGSGRELTRFVTNSTLGIGGFFDPARAWWGLEPSEEDFGQTLGFYGVGDGFPIMLPFMGNSNLRDLASMFPDYYLDPFKYLETNDKVFVDPVYVGMGTLQIINDTSLRLGMYENIKKHALDPYTFVRDAYKQNRDKKIRE